MKRIALFIDSLMSGGAQRQLVGLAKLLKDSGYEIFVFTYFDMPFYKPFLDSYGIPNCTVTSAENHIRRIPEMEKALALYSPEVVIAYGITPSIVSCILKMKGAKWKLIVSERNTSQAYSLTDRVRLNLYKYADYVVPNSYSQANYIRYHKKYYSLKIRTITNFVDANLFPYVYNNVKSDSDKFNIVIPARVAPQKNCMRFLDAIKIIKNKNINVHFDWYGYGYPKLYHDSVLNMVRTQCLEDMIIFHHDTKDILAVYEKSDALCLPSLYEGFPNVVCEAMSCGLPIICSEVCDNPFIVTDEVNGFLFNPYNIKEIASKIIKMVTLSSGERLRISQTNRERVLVLFSEQIFVKKYIDLIED